jgi:hypothetical protein
MSGISLTRIASTPPKPELITCQICKSIAKSPTTCSSCYELFCANCIANYVAQNKHCIKGCKFVKKVVSSAS